MQKWVKAHEEFRKPIYKEGEKEAACDSMKDFVRAYNHHFPSQMTHYLHLIHAHPLWFLGGDFISATVVSTQSNEARHKGCKKAVKSKSLHGKAITVSNASGQKFTVKHGAKYLMVMQWAYRIVYYTAHERVRDARVDQYTIDVADLNMLKYFENQNNDDYWSEDDLCVALGYNDVKPIHLKSSRKKFDAKDCRLRVSSATQAAMEAIIRNGGDIIVGKQTRLKRSKEDLDAYSAKRKEQVNMLVEQSLANENLQLAVLSETAMNWQPLTPTVPAMPRQQVLTPLVTVTPNMAQSERAVELAQSTGQAVLLGTTMVNATRVGREANRSRGGRGRGRGRSAG